MKVAYYIIQIGKTFGNERASYFQVDSEEFFLGLEDAMTNKAGKMLASFPKEFTEVVVKTLEVKSRKRFVIQEGE